MCNCQLQINVIFNKYASNLCEKTEMSIIYKSTKQK